MTCLVLNQKSSKGDVYPYIGSHLRYTPKRYINRIPSQKIGALTPIFVREVNTVSSQLPLFNALIIPAEMATIELIKRDNMPRCAVIGKLCFMMEEMAIF
jgi:hypothetical protein